MKQILTSSQVILTASPGFRAKSNGCLRPSHRYDANRLTVLPHTLISPLFSLTQQKAISHVRGRWWKWCISSSLEILLFYSNLFNDYFTPLFRLIYFTPHTYMTTKFYRFCILNICRGSSSPVPFSPLDSGNSYLSLTILQELSVFGILFLPSFNSFSFHYHRKFPETETWS